MKNKLIFLLCLVATTHSTNAHITRKKERAENAKIVLANLAQMIGNIGHIIEEPRNTDTVESAVANIVNNIVKITVNAIENKSITIEDAHAVLAELQDICKEYDENIVLMIQTKRMQLGS